MPRNTKEDVGAQHAAPLRSTEPCCLEQTGLATASFPACLSGWSNHPRLPLPHLLFALEAAVAADVLDAAALSNEGPGDEVAAVTAQWVLLAAEKTDADRGGSRTAPTGFFHELLDALLIGSAHLDQVVVHLAVGAIEIERTGLPPSLSPR